MDFGTIFEKYGMNGVFAVAIGIALRWAAPRVDAVLRRHIQSMDQSAANAIENSKILATIVTRQDSTCENVERVSHSLKAIHSVLEKVDLCDRGTKKRGRGGNGKK